MNHDAHDDPMGVPPGDLPCHADEDGFLGFLCRMLRLREVVRELWEEREAP